MINLDPEKTKYIYGRKSLSEYNSRPRVFIQTNNRYQFPYWEGDDIKKSHIKHFREYCDNNRTLHLSGRPDSYFSSRIYETIYYGKWKMKMIERRNKQGKITQLTILEISDWDADKEISDITSRFEIKSYPSGEERIDQPEYYNKLMNALNK
jgi:hypothetical protein